MGVPGRQVSGLTPPPRPVRRVSATRGRWCWSCRPTRDVEKLTADVRFFLSAYEGLSDDEVERSVLPFPSHEVDPYRGLAAALRHRLGARPGAARAGHRHGAGRHRVGGGAAAARWRRRSGLSTAALTCTPGFEISPTDLGRPPGGRRIHPAGSRRRVGGVLRPRRRGRLLSGRRRASHPPGVRRRHDRVGPHLRSGDAALDRRRSISAAIVPLTELPGGSETSGRSLGDVLRLPGAGRAAGAVRVGAGRGRRARPQDPRPGRGGYDDALARGQRAALPETLIARLGADRGTAARRHSARDAGARTRRAASRTSRRSRRSSSSGRLQDWVAEIKRGRERGDTMVFVAHTPGTRRADHRAARGLLDLRACRWSAPRTRTRASVLVGVGRLTRGFRLPDAGAPVLGRDRRLRGRAAGHHENGAGRRPGPSSPTSAT